LHPRLKESQATENASNDLEDLQRVCNVPEWEEQLQREEILQ